jgi:8-oxo-dGTP pyrophosphatase MutT (NUDIX family)
VIIPWRERLLHAVSPLESGVRGLCVNGLPPRDGEPYRPSKTAAVLVPFLNLPEPELVLTRRADHLPQHPGQVSFPGGAAERHDDSAVHTALREAQEEIGLPPGSVKPIGFLDRMDTVSDYRVLPVVAFVDPEVTWAPDEREVAEVFTIPVSIVLNRANYDAVDYQRNGQVHRIYQLRWREQKIWGVTAGMLMNLIVRLERANERADSGLGK